MNPDEVVLEHISKFVYWLAGRNADNTTPLMDREEIVGELFYEISKGMKYYEDRPLNELLALLRRMCDNRVSELKYKYYKTHRIAAKFTLDISILDADNVADEPAIAGHSSPPAKGSIAHKWLMDNAVTMEPVSDSAFRVAETRRRLSLVGQKVFDTVITGTSGRMATQILLAGMRASSVYKKGSVRIKPRHVSEAIPELSEKVVKTAFAEIRAAYREVIKVHG